MVRHRSVDHRVGGRQLGRRLKLPKTKKTTILATCDSADGRKEERRQKNHAEVWPATPAATTRAGDLSSGDKNDSAV